jgi:TM2 domain-containing membrane protein YozV
MTEDLVTNRKEKPALGLLCLAGVVLPGFQRFYLGQKITGWVFIVIGLFGLPFLPFPWYLKLLSYLLRVLCLAEGLWVFSLDNQDFDTRFNPEDARLEWTSTVKKQKPMDPEQQLESMRRQGLLTESEYQQKRKDLLAKISPNGVPDDED